MKNKLNRGFTLIELLVVIAIIGILAAVIIANLGGARSVARDGAVKSEMDSLRSQMELFSLYHGGSYGSAASCADSPFAGPASNAATDIIAGITGNGVTTMQCASNANAWAVSVVLPSDAGGNWCVDSSGQSKATFPAAGATAC